MRFFPARSWWLTPSGGLYGVHPGFWVVLLEAPLPAHLIGACAAAGALLPFGLGGFRLWWAATLLMGWWQLRNWEMGVYGQHWLREIVWRVLIGAVPLGLVLWLWEVRWLTS